MDKANKAFSQIPGMNDSSKGIYLVQDGLAKVHRLFSDSLLGTDREKYIDKQLRKLDGMEVRFLFSKFPVPRKVPDKSEPNDTSAMLTTATRAYQTTLHPNDANETVNINAAGTLKSPLNHKENPSYIFLNKIKNSWLENSTSKSITTVTETVHNQIMLVSSGNGAINIHPNDVAISDAKYKRTVGNHSKSSRQSVARSLAASQFR